MNPSQTIADTYFPVNNGTYAFAPTLDTVRHHIFPTTPLWKQGFISRDKEEDSASKEFLAINHFDEFIKKDVMESRKDRHLYELVTERTAVRPYFDLEWYVETAENANAYTAAAERRLEHDTLLDAVNVIGQALLNNGFIGNGISIFTASGPITPTKRKASYHILCDTVQVFKNAKHHGEFVKQYVIPLAKQEESLWFPGPDGPKCIIDTQPYGSSQSFRLPYQSKWKSSARPFVPFDVTPFRMREAGVATIGVYTEVGTHFVNPSHIETVGSHIETRGSHIGTGGSHIRPPSNHGPSAIHKTSLEFPKVDPLCALLTPEFLRGYTEAQNLIYCLWGLEQSDRMCTLIHAVCRRADNYEHAWVQNLIRSWKFSAFGIGSLVMWATACSDKARVSQVLKRHAVKYHAELFTAMKPAQHTVLHQRYLGDIAFDCDTLIIQSALGTGKTVSITNLIRRGGYARILIVSPRKSYTYSQHGVFQADGTLPPLKSYLDIMGALGAVDYLIVQAESLHRLGTFTPYDLVILDESESILCQMHSVTTHGKNMIANHQVLEKVVSSARHVIFADAFLSDRTFHMANALRTNIRYIENTFQPYQREAILLTSVEKDKRAANLGGFCERIMEALQAGRKIVVIWTSRRRGLWFIEHFLKGTEYSHIFYHSGSSKEEQLGLKDVHEAWRDIQCLMMTTSITVGISYNPVAVHEENPVGENHTAVHETNPIIYPQDENEGTIGGDKEYNGGGVWGRSRLHDEAFLYASSASALPRDIAQSLLRVRVLKANRLTYVLDTRVGGATGGFTSVWNQMAWKEQQQEKDHPLVQWTACPSWVRFNHCYNVNEERISRGEYREVLERYLVESGYTLREETHMPAAALAALPVLEDKEAIKWDNIEDVSWDGADDILGAMRRGEATAEEILCYKKWSFRTQFTETEGLKGWWERFYEAGREEAFWNVVREKRMSITDIATKEAEARYGIMTTAQIAQRKTLARFLGILGMQHSQEAVVLDAERLAALGEPLQAAEREIREGMGLRASRKKGDWGVSHTMDLIACVLESWGGVKVESIMRKKKEKQISTRIYSLQISGNVEMWNKIADSHVNYDENLLKL